MNNTKQHFGPRFGHEVATQYHSALRREAARHAEAEELVRLAGALACLADITASTGYSPDLLLPSGKKQPQELVRLVLSGSALHFIAPVCPPSDFHSSDALVSPEAHAAIRASKVITEEFCPELGIDASVTIMVADTEYDLPLVRERSGTEPYLERCADSFFAISKELGPSVTATTFTEYFNGNFHTRQYTNEHNICAISEENPSLRARLSQFSFKRSQLHERILMRPEENNELAIRYAAQYMTLGQEVRDEASPFNVILNYQSDNIAYYNHALTGPGVVPVFESRR